MGFGKFLGFMLTHKGIEANSAKCKAILEMKCLTSVKEVQCIIGHIASLFCFLVASARKALPLFHLMKKKTNFEWTSEYEQEFQGFKEYLSRPSILCKLEERKPLFLYLSVNEGAIATTFTKEEDKE